MPLLAIDVGNTQTVFGLFDGDELTTQFRVATDRNRTGDELAVMLRAFVDLATLEGIVLCSSVPQLVREYEADLELRLKREYTAVFGLFRYCVVTQDSTYLCNKLDLNYVPQPSYPFFHLKMEDVWVWDKNRPTRMIPRVEVYTSADVTVEELRGEGEEPALTAEALAKRMSDLASGDDL